MALIRVMAKRSGYQKWLDDDPNITELLRDPFGYEGEPVSVYEVLVGVDETKTISAHYLTYNRSSFDLVWALRINHEDCDGAGIHVHESRGNTEINEVDSKHRDLIGNEAQFKALIKRVLEAIHQGEDRIRLVGRSQLKHYVRLFAQYSSEEISKRTIGRCQKLLVCVSDQEIPQGRSLN